MSEEKRTQSKSRSGESCSSGCPYKPSKSTTESQVGKLDPVLAAAICPAGSKCQVFKTIFPKSQAVSEGHAECPANKCSMFDSQIGKSDASKVEKGCACGKDDCVALGCPLYRMIVQDLLRGLKSNSKDCPAFNAKCPAFQADNIDQALLMGKIEQCPAYNSMCPAFSAEYFKNLHGQHAGCMAANKCPAFHAKCPAFRAGNIDEALHMGNIEQCPAYSSTCPAFKADYFKKLHGQHAGCSAKSRFMFPNFMDSVCGRGKCYRGCGNPWNMSGGFRSKCPCSSTQSYSATCKCPCNGATCSAFNYVSGRGNASHCPFYEPRCPVFQSQEANSFRGCSMDCKCGCHSSSCRGAYCGAGPCNCGAQCSCMRVSVGGSNAGCCGTKGNCGQGNPARQSCGSRVMCGCSSGKSGCHCVHDACGRINLGGCGCDCGC